MTKIASPEKLNAALNRIERIGNNRLSTIYIRKLAEQGHVTSQVVLADILTSSEETEQEGIEWYKRAMFFDPKTAMFNLAMTYKNKGNISSYFYWIRKLADMGDPDAREELSSFLSGTGQS